MCLPIRSITRAYHFTVWAHCGSTLHHINRSVTPVCLYVLCYLAHKPLHRLVSLAAWIRSWHNDPTLTPIPKHDKYATITHYHDRGLLMRVNFNLSPTFDIFTRQQICVTLLYLVTRLMCVEIMAKWRARCDVYVAKLCFITFGQHCYHDCHVRIVNYQVISYATSLVASVKRIL